MSWIILIIIGAIIGWLASLIMDTNAQQGFLTNVFVGIVGALFGRLIFFDLFKIGSAEAAGAFGFWGIVWGVIGALALIAVLRVVRVLY